MKLAEVVQRVDIVITATGNKNVVSRDNMDKMTKFYKHTNQKT